MKCERHMLSSSMEVMAERSQSGTLHLPDEFNLSNLHFWQEANPHLLRTSSLGFLPCCVKSRKVGHELRASIRI